MAIKSGFKSYENYVADANGDHQKTSYVTLATDVVCNETTETNIIEHLTSELNAKSQHMTEYVDQAVATTATKLSENIVDDGNISEEKSYSSSKIEELIANSNYKKFKLVQTITGKNFNNSKYTVSIYQLANLIYVQVEDLWLGTGVVTFNDCITYDDSIPSPISDLERSITNATFTISKDTRKFTVKINGNIANGSFSFIGNSDETKEYSDTTITNITSSLTKMDKDIEALKNGSTITDRIDTVMFTNNKTIRGTGNIEDSTNRGIITSKTSTAILLPKNTKIKITDSNYVIRVFLFNSETISSTNLKEVGSSFVTDYELTSDEYVGIVVKKTDDTALSDLELKDIMVIESTEVIDSQIDGDRITTNSITEDKLAFNLNKKKTIHLSFDDVTFCWQKLAANQDTYTSIFEEPFFKALKEFHDEYGAVFSLYSFDSVELDTITSKFADEFKENSDWLKFGYHLGRKGYVSSIDYDSFITNMYRITGGSYCVDRVIRLDEAKATVSDVKKIRDTDCGILGLFAVESNRRCYYLTDEQCEYIRSHGQLVDMENGIVFYNTALRLEWFNSDFTSATEYVKPIKDNPYDELVYRLGLPVYADTYSNLEIYTHEWAVYKNDTIYSDKIDYVRQVCKFANDYGYQFEFQSNTINPGVRSVTNYLTDILEQETVVDETKFDNINIASSGAESRMESRVSNITPFPSTQGYYFNIDSNCDIEYRVAGYKADGTFIAFDKDWRQGKTEYSGANTNIRRIVFRHKTDNTTALSVSEIAKNLDTNIPELLTYVTLVKSELNKAKADIVNIEDKLFYETYNLFDLSSYIRRCYLDTNCEVQYLSGGAWNLTNYIDISGSQDGYVYYSNVCDNNSTKVLSAFYDEDYNLVSSFSQIIGTDITQEIPKGAKYVRISFKENNKEYMSIYIKGIHRTTTLAEVNSRLIEESIPINGYQQGVGGLAYTYWISPQVIFDDYGYPTDGSGGDYHNYQIFVGTVNKEGSAGVATINVNDESRCKNIAIHEVGVDLHNSTAIFYGASDEMIVFSTKHNSTNNIKIFKAKRTHDASSFRYVGQIVFPEVCTYSQVFYYNKQYHLFSRVGTNNWYWCKSSNLVDWEYVNLVAANQQYYCLFKQTTTDGMLRIVMYSNPNANDLNIREGFLDLNTGNVYNADGNTVLGTESIASTSFDVIIPITSGKQRLLDVADNTAMDDLRILYTTFSDATNMVYKTYVNGTITELATTGTALFENIYVPAGGVIAKNGQVIFISCSESDNYDHIKRYKYDSTNKTYTLVGDEYVYENATDKYRACYLTTDRNSKVLVWTEGYYHNQQYYNWNPELKYKLI